MRLLVVEDQYHLAASLQRQLDVRAEPITIERQTWQNFQQQDLAQPSSQPSFDAIICAVLLTNSSNDDQRQQYADCVKRLVLLAKRQQIPLLFLSTTAVFDGARIAYQETDAVSPNTHYGSYYVGLEQQVARWEKHIIIRTGWLYGAGNDNYLTAAIAYAANDKLISFNSAGKACPTAIEDVARVILAIVLQLQYATENWGIYHYVASDTALGFQFIEAILMQAAKYETNVNAKQVRFEHSSELPPDPLFYFVPVVLRCSRVLDDFGIHQRSWRALMPAAVRSHFEDKKKGA